MPIWKIKAREASRLGVISIGMLRINVRGSGNVISVPRAMTIINDGCLGAILSQWVTNIGPGRAFLGVDANDISYDHTSSKGLIKFDFCYF